MSRLLDLPPEPWRNGGGVTRTVARGEEDAGGELWRVSAAEITTSGAFSRFPNMDRQAMLIAGGPLTLVVACTPNTMAHVGDTVRFSGEADSAVTLTGRPARFWNVMTRRGGVFAEVTLIRHEHGPLVLEASATSRRIVLVLAGACQWASPEQGTTTHHEVGDLLLPTPGKPGLIQSESPDTVLLHTRIQL
ncbi:MAG: HutD family protein [Aquabacterium sp.]|uniref:HutD/Ves family protein n=1 Tax=Aquabacterium sp. TaxID=1872578 RepID=UPI002721DFFC|nr:HutD family protein [Aquabacterium sp.]MDO9002460.1 HutD family protein [Aquabacterium sp.]